MRDPFQNVAKKVDGYYAGGGREFEPVAAWEAAGCDIIHAGPGDTCAL
ncbi:MAG: hypothetical protein JWR26_495 [Pedosphaera sp.]|nr:hypothetical protein [Pedosphaera sp.]